MGSKHLHPLLYTPRRARGALDARQTRGLFWPPEERPAAPSGRAKVTEAGGTDELTRASYFRFSVSYVWRCSLRSTSRSCRPTGKQRES